jgi:hypothetical protein
MREKMKGLASKYFFFKSDSEVFESAPRILYKSPRNEAHEKDSKSIPANLLNRECE